MRDPKTDELKRHVGQVNYANKYSNEITFNRSFYSFSRRITWPLQCGKRYMLLVLLLLLLKEHTHNKKKEEFQLKTLLFVVLKVHKAIEIISLLLYGLVLAKFGCDSAIRMAF